MPILKKSIGPNQVDGVKIQLLNNQTLRGQTLLGADKDLFKVNTSDKIEFAELPVLPGGGNIASEDYVDTQIASVVAGENTEVTARIAAVAAEVTARNAAVAVELSARAAADVVLQANIDAEITARIAAIAGIPTPDVSGQIAVETSARIAADDAISASLTAEVTNRTAAVTALASQKDATGGFPGMTGFKINLKNQFGTVGSYLSSSNTQTRTFSFQDRDGTIADNTDISNEVTARNAAIAIEATARDAAILVETNARVAADSAEVTARNAAIAVETTARIAGDATEAAARDAAIAVETTARIAADALKANLASPAFSGTPTAPTQSQADNSTKLATTAYVDAGLASAGSLSLVYDAIVGAAAGCTDATIAAAITRCSAGARILVVDSFVLGSSIDMTKANMLIELKPAVVISAGAATVGFNITAAGCMVRGGKISGFTTGINVQSGGNRFKARDIWYSGNTTDLSDTLSLADSLGCGN